MEQTVNELQPVAVDYSVASLPASVRLFKPLLFTNAAGYFCLWGPSPKTGIYGCGDSQQAAISDWVNHLEARVNGDLENDPLGQRLSDEMVKAKIDFRVS